MLHGLKADDRLAKLAPHAGIREGFFHGSGGNAERLRRDPGTRYVEGGLRHQKSASFTADEISLGNSAVVEFQLIRPVGPNAHLFFFAAEFKAGVPFVNHKT